MSEQPTPIRIGTAGWSLPRQSPDETGTHLERYARTFSCCEINSSFYRPHRPATWQRWATSVPDNFRFSVKAPRAITHEAALDISADTLARFLEQAQNLGSKLGPILFQLAPKFAFEPSRAEIFLTLLRMQYDAPVAFEPRHPTWFTPAAEVLFSRFQIARVAADPPPTPAADRPASSDALTYYRLHGSPRIYYSTYSPRFLEDLAQTLSASSSQGAAWCIFDNTALGAATQNARELQRLATA